MNKFIKLLSMLLVFSILSVNFIGYADSLDSNPTIYVSSESAASDVTSQVGLENTEQIRGQVIISFVFTKEEAVLMKEAMYKYET